jgi:hypothetical protein
MIEDTQVSLFKIQNDINQNMHYLNAESKNISNELKKFDNINTTDQFTAYKRQYVPFENHLEDLSSKAEKFNEQLKLGKQFTSDLQKQLVNKISNDQLIEHSNITINQKIDEVKHHPLPQIKLISELEQIQDIDKKYSILNDIKETSPKFELPRVQFINPNDPIVYVENEPKKSQTNIVQQQQKIEEVATVEPIVTNTTTESIENSNEATNPVNKSIEDAQNNEPNKQPETTTNTFEFGQMHPILRMNVEYSIYRM